MRRYEAQARRLLTALRNGCINDTYGHVLWELERELELRSLKLADIGTNEEEIKRLEQKAEALRLLSALRSGGNGNLRWPDVAIEMINQALKEGGYNLSDIGTNQEELNGLRHECWKGAAEYYLYLLREPPAAYHHITTGIECDTILTCLKEALEKIGLSLSDIGTSEEEIERLAKELKAEIRRSEERFGLYTIECNENTTPEDLLNALCSVLGPEITEELRRDWEKKKGKD